MEKETPETKTQVSFTKKHLTFFLILFALTGAAVVRSSITTGLDSFTFDEAYHIGAGAVYVKTGDFRLNPEHPPLTKLWVGTFVADVYQMSDFRVLQDKNDERKFVEKDVYNNSDADLIQSRSRAAMFALNGLLLFLFALAARRVFGDVIALAAIGFLVIDPTIAAHLPVVMTDLPVALTSATAVLMAVQAFRSWRAVDLIFASLALGLALSAKHSAVIAMIAVALIGVAGTLWELKREKLTVHLKRLSYVAAVLVGAVIVLWSFYLFRFAESSNTAEEQFNRPLAEKISDVKSPVYRAGLNVMGQGRLFPRAYTWGMADTIRAGAEGRVSSTLAFGRLYYGKAPFYYFPGILAVKLPLGLLFLTLIGAGFLIARQISPEFFAPLIGLGVLTVLFWIVFAKGSSYGGIRHVLPAVPLLAVLAGIAIYKTLEYKSYLLRGAVAAASIAALLSAVPVMRPWEYFNETVGTRNAYLYFNDEGTDLGLRLKEIVGYYDENLKPQGEIPYVEYFGSYVELRKRGLDFIGKNEERDKEKLKGESIEGTFIFGAGSIAPSLWWDKKPFREAVPVARFGNVFVYRGKFKTSDLSAAGLYWTAISKIYIEKPETEKAIKLLNEVVEHEPKAFFAALELGNQYLKTGNRDEALKAYRIAKENAPESDDTRELLDRQIKRFETGEPIERITPIRNPSIE